MIRRFVRIMLMAALGVVLCMYVLNVGNRGFLPQSHRTIWLTASPTATSSWDVSILGASDDPPEHPAGQYLIGIQEQSMGRRNPGMQRWRSNTWIVVWASDDDGRDLIEPRGFGLIDDGLQSAIGEFVVQDLAPDSVALGHWPTTSGVWRNNTDEAVWRYWQERTNWVLLSICLIGSLLVSVLVVSLLIPAKRRAPETKIT